MPVAHLQIKYKASAARMSEATSKSTPMRRIRSARCDRAADQSDEVAPLHSLVSPVLKIEWIAHFDGSRRLLRCGISIPAYDRSGSNPDSLLGGRTSGSASCGHAAALALGSNVPEH